MIQGCEGNIIRSCQQYFKHCYIRFTLKILILNIAGTIVNNVAPIFQQPAMT